MEYVILAMLITAAIISAVVHLELQVPRLFQNAGTVLKHAVPDGSGGKDGGNGGGGSLESEPPPVSADGGAR